MATKAELEDEVNEKLGTDMNWSKMTKDDLELFNELIDSGVLIEKLAKHMAKEMGTEKYEQVVDDWHLGKIVARLI